VGSHYGIAPGGGMAPPSVNYQILLHFVVCAGAAMILALVFIRQNRDSVRGQAASHFRS
jgi:hypothetical protein